MIAADEIGPAAANGPADAAGSFPSRQVRLPAVAGQFYPGDAALCRTLAEQYLAKAPSPAALGKWIGGIVPHAGWICSGAIAGRTIAAIRDARQAIGGAVDVVVVFGAVHTPLAIHQAALDSHERWATPLNQTPTSQEIARKLREKGSELFALDDRFHAHEHAVEVELPLIQLAFGGAIVLPVEVPAIDNAVEIGRRTAQEISAAGLKAVYLASSDLTHYGPMYGFAPAGLGLPALEWAKDNDRRLLQTVTDFSPEQVVPEVRRHFNACGAGAIAAAMSACRENGASSAAILRHANSYETLADVHPQLPHNAVGYASAVFG